MVINYKLKITVFTYMKLTKKGYFGNSFRATDGIKANQQKIYHYGNIDYLGDQIHHPANALI